MTNGIFLSLGDFSCCLLASEMRKKYLAEVEAMLQKRFPTYESVIEALQLNRVQRQRPAYLADWHELIVIDGEIVAELKFDSYFVKVETNEE